MKTYQERLEQVHPLLQEKALKLIELAKKEGINILITQGFRTYEEQAKIYSQGRTTPGRIVSQAKPGHSFHNFGLAFDFAVYNADGKINWSVSKEWLRVGELGESLGLEWGGRWTKFVDNPHFQLTFGLSTAELRAGKKPPTQKEEKTMELKKTIVICKEKEIEAVLINGVSYAPVRELAELLDHKVHWDNKNVDVIEK